jgi:hypothetical protein
MESALFNILHMGIQIKHNKAHESTKMMQKIHLAQNRSINLILCPIFVQKNNLHYLTEPCFP